MMCIHIALLQFGWLKDHFKLNTWIIKADNLKSLKWIRDVLLKDRTCFCTVIWEFFVWVM